MEKKKFNFKKLGIVLCICFVTLFAFIPFANFNTINSVSAATIDNDVSICATASDGLSDYTFKSNSIIFPTGRYGYYYKDNARQFAGNYHYNGYTNTTNFSYLFTQFSVELRYDDNGDLLFAPYLDSFNLVTVDDTSYDFSTTGKFHLEPYSFMNYMSTNYSNYKYGYAQGFGYYNFDNWGDETEILFTRGGTHPYFESGDDSTIIYGVGVKLSRSTEVLDITRITKMTTSFKLSSTGRSVYSITYYDINDNYVKFAFGSGKWNYGDIPSSTYYFSNDGIITDNDMYSQGYDSGHTDGYNFGYNLGLGEGYDVGYESGNTIGYNNGYNDGVTDSNEYTFHSLFGAVLDAPVKVFSGLFNFELLGINLLGLITGLFTLAMIMLILKLVFGGK